MKKATPWIVGGGMVTLVVVGLALARPAASPAPAPTAAAPAAATAVAGAEHAPPAPEGFTVIPAIWRAERARWCGLITVGENPKLAGVWVTARLELGLGNGVANNWVFVDEAGRLTLNTLGSRCFSAVRLKRDPGSYQFTVQLPTDTVARDPAVDARSVQDPAWRACFAAETEPTGIIDIATVVDTDGTVWTSDGTRSSTGIRTCAGQAHRAWVEEQVKAGTLGLTAPAVVVGRDGERPSSRTAPAAPAPGP